MRIVQAVVRSEIVRLRGGRAPVSPSAGWAWDMPLGDEGLGIDSLAMFGVLAALAEMFDLDAGTLAEHPPERLQDLADWVGRSFGGTQATVTVATSGSTGSAKRCRHVLADLLEESAYFAAMTAGRQRVVAMVPADHLYGLIWTALLPATLDVPVVERCIGTRLDLKPGDLVVAVPEHWRVLPRLAAPLPEDVWGVSSGGPLHSDVEAAMLAGGVERVIDIYGASELSGIAVRVAPDPSHRLLPRWHLTVGDDAVIDRLGRRFPLPDHVIRAGDRAICLMGRHDEAVQVGGHNVWPQRVAALLRDVPGVADAAVRLGDDVRLKAYIVPDAGFVIQDVERSVGRLLSTLPVAERPLRVTYGASLPRSALGKLKDWL